MKRLIFLLAKTMVGLYSLTCAVSLTACGQVNSNTKQKNQVTITSMEQTDKNTAVATFGAGCFWCVEAVFQRLEGVEAVYSGYMGGYVENPTYKQVCTGNTGHAEVCRIVYNPEKVSFETLLEVFWATHDPTTLNRQGNDIGTQYRSVIFYHNEEQKRLAEKSKRELEAAKVFDNPIVTEISPASTFYKAEDYHQNYYNLNSSQPYCVYVAKPKIDKFYKLFKDKAKKN